MVQSTLKIVISNTDLLFFTTLYNTIGSMIVISLNSSSQVITVIWLFSGEQIFISPLCKGNKCIMFHGSNY